MLVHYNDMGTSINDVRRFLDISDLPTYHVRRFLPHNIGDYGAFFGPAFLSYNRTSFMDVPLPVYFDILHNLDNRISIYKPDNCFKYVKKINVIESYSMTLKKILKFTNLKRNSTEISSNQTAISKVK